MAGKAQQASLDSKRFMAKSAVSFHLRGHVLHMGRVQLFPVHINPILSGRPGHVGPSSFHSLLTYGCSWRGHQHSYCSPGVKGKCEPATGGECTDDSYFTYLNGGRLPQLDVLDCSLYCHDVKSNQRRW